MDLFTKSCIVIFIISISSLYAISIFYIPREETIKKSLCLEPDDFVTISGKIAKVRTINKQTFLTITEENSITAITNTDPNINYSNLIGTKLKLKGKIEEFDEDKQLRIYGFVE